MKWYLQVLMKYAQFGGRARRKEYWMFNLFYLLIAFAIGVVFTFVGLILGIGTALTTVAGNIYLLAMFIPGIAVGVRRLHDTGRSGWWILLPIVNLIFFCLDSQPGENKYGPNPKGVAAGTVEEGGVTLPIVLAIAVVALLILGFFAALSIHAYQDYQLRVQEAKAKVASSAPAMPATVDAKPSVLPQPSVIAPVSAPSTTPAPIVPSVATPSAIPPTMPTSDSPSEFVTQAPVSQAARNLKKDRDLRYCLELKTDAEIIACTGK